MRPQPSLCPACWRRRRKSFKEESPPNGEFYPIPRRTHPFFIVIPNRPSHISHPRLPPTSLIQSPPPFFLLQQSHTPFTPSLRLHITFLLFSPHPSPRLFLAPAPPPPPLFSLAVRFPFVHRPSLLAAILPVLHPRALRGSVAVIMKCVVNRY